MPALGNLYRIISKGVCLGVPCSNIWHYECVSPLGAVPDATVLAAGFVANVVSDLIPIMSELSQYNEFQVDNLDDPTDFAVLQSTQVGLATGECMPPFVAWGFELKRLTRDGRSGRKSIFGVSEDAVSDGVVAAGFVAAVNAAAIAIGSDITVSSVTYSPVVYRRPSDALPSGTVWRTDGAIYKRVTEQRTRIFSRS